MSFPFEPKRLSQELLALGNPKITPAVAQQISEEIGKELKQRPKPQITAEVISGMVAFKLKELGVLNNPKTPAKKSNRTSTQTKTQEAKTQAAASQKAQQASPQVSLQNSLSKKSQETTLPTLEKFLAPAKSQQASGQETAQDLEKTEIKHQDLRKDTPLPEAPQNTPQNPAPPRASVQVAAEGLKAWNNAHEATDLLETAELRFKQNLIQLAERAALANTPVGQTPSATHSHNTLAVEFFNTMANQEFYPHVPSLLAPQDWRAAGDGFVWIDLLSLSLAAHEQVLVDVKKLWQGGHRVGLILSTRESAPALDAPKLGTLLRDLNEARQDLVESAAPYPISFYLDLHHPESVALLEVLVSSELNIQPLVEAQIYLSYNKATEDEHSKDDAAPLVTFNPALQAQLKDTPLRLHWVDPAAAKPNPLAPGLTLPRPSGGPALAPYETCQLGSVNLSVCVSGGEVDFTKLKRILHTGLHFLDNLVEAKTTPLEKISQRSSRSRKLGLGVMGWAEMLAKLGCAYDSPAAHSVAKRVAAFIGQESLNASIQLAKQRGTRLTQNTELRRHATLNATVSAAQLAQLAGVSPGLKPLQNLLQSEGDQPYVRPVLQKLAQERGLWSSQVESDLIRWNSLQPSPEAHQNLKRLLLTEREVAEDALLNTAQAWQAYCDGTLVEALQPKDSVEILATFQQEEVEELSAESTAEENREENAPENIATSAAESAEENDAESTAKNTEETTETKAFVAAVPRARPQVLPSRTYQMDTALGPLKITVGFDEWGPYEIRLDVDKAGSAASAEAEALSRLSSLLLRHNVKASALIEELRGIHSPLAWQRSPATDAESKILSLADALSQVLAQETNWQEATAEALALEESEELTVVENLESPTESLEEVTEITERFKGELQHLH